MVRGLLWVQSHGTVIIGTGVAVTGLGLVAVLGTQLLSQPWLLVALSIYAANLAAAFFIQRPGVRRLPYLRPRRHEGTTGAPGGGRGRRSRP